MYEYSPQSDNPALNSEGTPSALCGSYSYHTWCLVPGAWYQVPAINTRYCSMVNTWYTAVVVSAVDVVCTTDWSPHSLLTVFA